MTEVRGAPRTSTLATDRLAALRIFRAAPERSRMVIVRLARRGTKQRPFYHIVATDNASRRDGRFIEQIGTFDPHKPDGEAFLQQERLDYWVGNGAQLSTRVSHILRAKKKAAVSA
jgi:small subunit ribosomal protein S16